MIYRHTDTTGILLSTSGACRRAEPAVEPNDDSHLRSCVDHFTHTDWASKQRTEPLCSAAIRFFPLNSPSPSPDDFLDFIPDSRRPRLSEVLTLAAKARLHATDDGTVFLVHRSPPPAPHPTDRAPPTDLPPRVHVPMRMRRWVLHTCHTTSSYHLGIGRTLSLLMSFFVMDWHGHPHPLVASPQPNVSGT